MKSPFPGMDPYLEDPAFWRDFHHKFINYWQETIVELLPEHYEARVDENIYLCEEVVDSETVRAPDIMVLRSRSRKGNGAVEQGGTATLTPVTLPLIVPTEFNQGHIKLIHRASRRVVAVLELLSPANKRDPGKREYLAKRQQMVLQPVHMIELDLLLGGDRVPFGQPLPRADYFYLVRRSNRRFECDVYSWNLQDRLPVVPIPLQSPDPDIHCNLQEVFDTTYQRGRYRKDIDYKQLPLVGFSAAQKKWMRQQLKKA